MFCRRLSSQRRMIDVMVCVKQEVVDFWARYQRDLWQDHADGYEIAPGIKVLRTPGHTEEDASLVVETKGGTYALTPLWWLPDMTRKKTPWLGTRSNSPHIGKRH
jgi:hypothetical protein